MQSAQFKAILIIVLIFGGLAWYLFGGKLSMPDMPDVKSWFASEEPTVKTTSNKSKARSATKSTGKVIDSYKGVKVYDNGSVGNVSGRNTTADGYNLGLKYQCVEFAKRFYYEVHNHKMPDSYGHARDFFDGKVGQGEINRARGMRQYWNGGPDKPQPNDLVVIGPSAHNSFGHLFILTKVNSEGASFIQQNPGLGNPSRGIYPLSFENGKWYIQGQDIVGWLRMP